jgi:membrane protein YdbS with pleckstrin-like domain
MTSTPVIVRTSPFVFLKRVVVVEFFFAFLPLILVLVFGSEEEYAALGLVGIVSYPLAITLVMTILQVLIIGLTFTSWYVPSYEFGLEQIMHRRANLFEDKKLADTQSITAVEAKSGWLGRRLDYGNLTLRTVETSEKVKQIPDPTGHKALIEELIAPAVSPTTIAVPELIAGGENQRVEFKSSLMWDYHRQAANKDLYEPVMKNVVAFMNAGGGTLLIGVDDEGQILGLEPDFKTMKKGNTDSFENIFNMAFNRMIGAEYRHYVDLTFPELEGKVVCVIAVQPSALPAYMTFKGAEKFYIRAGNGSQSLTVRKATQYIQDRFTS